MRLSETGGDLNHSCAGRGDGQAKHAPLGLSPLLSINHHEDGPRQMAPREELADSRESRRKRHSPGPRDRKSRAHARFSIDSLRCLKIERLDGG